jgi:hypothetical protein
MATKLLKNIDEDVWRKFTGICKMKNNIVGQELSQILKKYINNGGRI